MIIVTFHALSSNLNKSYFCHSFSLFFCRLFLISLLLFLSKLKSFFSKLLHLTLFYVCLLLLQQNIWYFSVFPNLSFILLCQSCFPMAVDTQESQMQKFFSDILSQTFFVSETTLSIVSGGFYFQGKMFSFRFNFFSIFISFFIFYLHLHGFLSPPLSISLPSLSQIAFSLGNPLCPPEFCLSQPF